MYRASKCTRDGSSWMWLAGHMQWQLFRLVWGMRAKFGLCYCVLNCKLLSVLPDNASCLCIRLCFTVSKINLSLQIRKSSTKQKKKKKKRKWWCLNCHLRKVHPTGYCPRGMGLLRGTELPHFSSPRPAETPLSRTKAEKGCEEQWA